MKTSSSTAETRWAKRSPRKQLLYKFLNEYGYERGEVVAKAIVEDIFQLINTWYGDALPLGHITWPAVPVHNGHSGKSPEIHQLVNVRLQMVTNEEVALLNDQKLCGQRKARRAFNQARFVRWCQQAYDQGGVLTLLDLSLLSGLSEGMAGYLIRHYEQDHDATVPIRGTVHDIGPSVSHKAEVVRRFLKGQSPADIARDLHHSQQAVDAYIKDYEITRKLVQKFPVTEISSISRRTLSVVKEHIKLIRQYEPNICFFSPKQA
jgi:hypothetical protein